MKEKMQSERLQNPEQFPLMLGLYFAKAKSNNRSNYISLEGPEIPICTENIMNTKKIAM